MKRFLLILLTALLAFPAWAAGGEFDGSTESTAIPFNWEEGNVQDDGTFWYRVDLSPLYDEVEDPTLALYLTNLSENDVTVTLKVTLFGNTEERTYTIGSKQNKIWSIGAGMLVQTNTQEIKLTLSSTGEVALSANVYETEDVKDEGCLNATYFYVEEGATKEQNADTEVWYQVDLTDAIDTVYGFLATNDIDITIKNNGTATATVQAALSMDCPASGLTEYTLYIPADGTATRTLKRAMIEMLQSNSVYLRVNTDQKITITTTPGEEPSATPIFTSTDDNTVTATTDTVYTLTGTQIYKIHLDSLRGKRVMPEVTVTNNGTSEATITAKIGMTAAPKSVIEKTVTLGAGQSLVKAIEKNMIDGISTQDSCVYVQIITTQPIAFSARLKHVNEGNACKNSVNFNWTTGHTQEANTTVWYAVNIAEAKTNVQDIILTVENLSGETATMTAEVAFSCPYIDLQSVTRTLASPATKTQTIGYSLFGMLTTNEVYVGLTTNQRVKITATTQPVVKNEPDDACLRAKVFDMTEGGKQNAGDTVWYKVGRNSLRTLDQLPYVSIQNRGTAPVTIHAALSLDCPDSIPNSERSLTIGVGGTYEKLISRDLLYNIDRAYDTVYVMLTANQAFAFQVQLKEENLGATCKSAIRFNWTSGNDQNADTDLWYLVDLTAAKAGKKDIQLSIINKDNAAATLSAAFAFDCPCEVPQTESTQLGALAYKTTTLPYSALETAGNTVWVRLSTDRTIHFEAALVDPAPFDTIDCADITLNALVLNNWYQDVTDTTWFILTGSVLERLKNAGDSTIKLYLRNKVSTANTITAHVAYHCPITSTMVSRQVALSGNQWVEKLLERNFIEQIADKDTVLVRLAATNEFSFLAEIVDPNDGADCLHAIPFDIPNSIGKQLGPHETRWYKLDVDSVSKINKMITFGIRNVDGMGSRVNVALYTSCDSAALIERTITLGRNEGITKEFSSDIFKGLNTRYLYLKVDAEYGISLNATVASLTPLTPPIEACLDAYPVAPNTEYTLSAGDTAWYVVNMQDLRANTEGDGVLTIWNKSRTDKLTAKAECSWTCPVVYQMTDITRFIAADGQYTQRLARSSIDATSDSLLYVRVTTNQPLSFRLDITYSKGETCDNPIEFDWVNGNIHSAGKPLWYRVALDEEKVPAGKDLLLSIENLVDTDNGAGAALYMECGETQMASKDYTLQAGETKDITIDSTLLASAGWTNLFIYYNSNKNTKIYTGFVEHAKRHDTTYVRICEGKPWTNPVTDSVLVFYAPTSDSAYLSAPLRWSDTVRVRGSLNCDSIYTFIVTPLHLPAPFQLTADTLAKYNAVPVLKQGMEVFTDFSRLNILSYLANNDSVELITDSCKWKNVPEGVIAKGTDSITLTLHLVEDSCNTYKDYNYTFPVAPYRVDSMVINTALCSGSDFTTRLDSTYTLLQDTIVRDTVACITTDTLGLDLHFDSVYIYRLRVKPILKDSIAATICQGTTYTFGDETFTNDTVCTKTFTSAVTGCDSIVTLTLTVRRALTSSISATICQGTTYTFGDETFTNDTVCTKTFTSEVTGCDSIVTLNLQVNPKLYTSIKDTICEGETYVFGTQNLTEAGTHQETFEAITGCDSIVSLELTVLRNDLPAITADDVQAVCGQAVDTTKADKIIADHITADGYAEGAQAQWMILNGNTWEELSSDAIDGQTKRITLKLVVTSNCGTFETEEMTIEVEQPDPSNTSEMKDQPAVSKYNNYLLMINLNAIQDNLGWTLKEEDVTWYKVVGDADPTYPDDTKKDIEVGTGFYYTTGEQIVGNYYALIEHEKVEASDCEQHAISTVLMCANSGAAAPALQSTMVNPGQAIYILHLNPLTQTEIRVYDIEGNLLQTYTSTEAEKFLIRAASQQGFYMVDVQTDEQKTTLRYIVK